MSYQCEQCTETTTFKNVIDGIFKIAVVAGLGYVILNYKSELKEAVQSVVKKAKDLNGTSDSVKRKKVSIKRQPA